MPKEATVTTEQCITNCAIRAESMVNQQPVPRLAVKMLLFVSTMLPGLVAFAAGGQSVNMHAERYTQYDHYFKNYTHRYFARDLSWQWFKAQGIVESQLKHHSKSHRGAQGVMQIMPATYKYIQKKNRFFKHRDIKSLEFNIAAGIFYDSYLYDRWDLEVSKAQRIRLMLASYNAGYSRVLKAFVRAGRPENDWEAVANYLPRETRKYVDAIQVMMRQPVQQKMEEGTRQIFASTDLYRLGSNYSPAD